MNMLEKANRFIEQNHANVVKQYRPQYHLAGKYGWINDPNGFIYYKGQYHLFYQHNPYESIWGPPYWGHAVSSDLIRWKYLPIALAPDKPYDKDGCFSGSAIEKDENLYLLYTGHVICDAKRQKNYRQTQCLAFSYDGVNFVKYAKNPVIGTADIPAGVSKSDIRDPKVFKREENYYMILGSNNGYDRGQGVVYTSSDLKKWKFLNIIGSHKDDMGNNWECPDLFELEGRDILIVSLQHFGEGSDLKTHHEVVYSIGDFDASTGRFEFEDHQKIDMGFDFYAPQTTIDSKGRRLIVAWMNNWNTENPTHVLNHKWAGAMTMPREIKLVGEQLYFLPIDEIKKYRKNEFSLEHMLINGLKRLNSGGDCYEINIKFLPIKSNIFGVKLRTDYKEEETVLSYNIQDKVFSFNRDKSGIGPKGKCQTKVELKDGILDLRIFVDKCSVEIFINNGQKVMTGLIYPSEDSKGIALFSDGECEILSLKKWELM